MEKIIDPIDVRLLLAELTPDKKLCNTNKGGNEIFIIDAFNAPNVMREIGRLREIAFRRAGGCSGFEVDIDEFDTMDSPYSQIVIWNPEEKVIIGGYRFILGPDVKLMEDGQPRLATAHMFHFSDKFIKEYLPHTMELGRSFVTPEFQSSQAGAKGIFAMDNLWDGITAVMMQHSNIFFFFGKMTIYADYEQACQDLIYHFLWKHFPDKDELVRPIKPILPVADAKLLNLILKDDDLKSDFRNLKEAIRNLNSSIPPLVNSYIKSSSTMKMLGTAENESFGNAVETGILMCFDEMYSEKRDRHKLPYLQNLIESAGKRFPMLDNDVLEKIVYRKEQTRMKAFISFLSKTAHKISNIK